MTREEAKVFMLQFNTDKRLNPSEHEAVRVAIKVLEQEPCEDCISRQQAIDKMQELENEDIEAYGCSIPEGFDGKRAIEALKALPSIQPTTKENLVVEDCINRAELLKAVDTWDKFGCDADSKLVPYKDCYVPYIHYDDVVKAIKGMQSVQPKARWIPVTEDLPKTPDDVLVWFEYIKDDYDCAWWGLAYYSLRYKKWVVSTNEHNPIVKAWTPLPEPYEPTISEKEDEDNE